MSVDYRIIEAESTYRELSRIKQIREDAAANFLKKKQAFFYQILQELSTTDNKLTNYRLWMKLQERKTYQKILSRQLPMRKLSALRRELANLTKNEKTLMNHLEKLQRQRKQAEQELNQARTDYQMARRQVVKFEALEDLVRVEKKKLQELVDEKRLEEFTTKMRKNPLLGGGTTHGTQNY